MCFLTKVSFRKIKQQRTVQNSRAVRNIWNTSAVTPVDHTSTFSFTLSKLVVIYFHVTVCKNLVISDLLLQYMPDRKIFILTKPTEAFTKKYSAEYLFWIMYFKFLKNNLELIISVVFQAANGLLEVGLHVR